MNNFYHYNNKKTAIPIKDGCFFTIYIYPHLSLTLKY